MCDRGPEWRAAWFAGRDAYRAGKSDKDNPLLGAGQTLLAIAWTRGFRVTKQCDEQDRPPPPKWHYPKSHAGHCGAKNRT